MNAPWQPEDFSAATTADSDLLAFAKSFDIYMRVAYVTPDSHILRPQAAELWRACIAALAKAEGR